MTRPALVRAAAALLAAVAVTTAAALLTPASSVADETSTGTRTPLKVSVDTMAPAVVPRSGPVALTGQVTNRSQETWTDLKVYVFTSDSPITTRAELATAAATSEDEFVGTRRTSEGLYDQVGDLAPGETTSYRVSVPRADLGLGEEPGVYWIGVHVLGADGDGIRDSTADGRARTFIPLVPRGTAPTRLALLVPVKSHVRRGTAARLLTDTAWQRSLSADGRLDRLLNLSGRATQPLTWVVDPAVLDAARSVAEDNPKLDPGPATSGPGSSSGPSPSGSESPEDGATGTGSDEGDVGAAAEPSSEAVAARAWLEEFRRQAPTHTVTTVPYGDLDVAAVLGTRLEQIYQRATALSAETMASLGIDHGTAVLDPVNGRLPAAALHGVGAGSPVLLGTGAFPDAQQPVLTHEGRAPVVLIDEGAGSGGPGPTRRRSALAVRQRLLSDAALHALSADRSQPLVVSTPAYWNPGPAWNDADFFADLDQPWLRMVDLSTVLSGAGSVPADASGGAAPVYSRSDRNAELPLANLLATQRLDKTGRTYGRLLTADDTVQSVLARVAMLASSQGARENPERALRQVDGTTGYVRAQMQQVRIEGPEFVMMSGEQGPIQVTLVNGLDQPVRVGIAAQNTGSGLTISRHDPVTLGPGKRTAIRLRASSSDIGVHAVTLLATDGKGEPIGSRTQFTVRTSRVSTVIWVIMAVGGALLFLTIAVRLVGQIRRRKSTHGPRLPREAPAPPGQEIGA